MYNPKPTYYGPTHQFEVKVPLQIQPALRIPSTNPLPTHQHTNPHSPLHHLLYEPSKPMNFPLKRNKMIIPAKPHGTPRLAAGIRLRRDMNHPHVPDQSAYAVELVGARAAFPSASLRGKWCVWGWRRRCWGGHRG
ncbi:hypothetical protein BJX66DRAFT_318561 [Aspergillus keveii]|uniref:Uncharacterized protein n=1 Tax=Aspergillus keveii TaxID=714993 RepID=A0ABR4FJI3_9EURO